MDFLMIILCAVIVIGVLVFIHEGGHFLAARAFGVRVTEFMIGLPGPNIGFRKGGTKFGLTAVPLGGYAKVCGMETGVESPYLEQVLTYVSAHGTATIEEVAETLGISADDAEDALDELVEWGSIVMVPPREAERTYRTASIQPTKRQIREAKRLNRPIPATTAEGDPLVLPDPHEHFLRERKQQYRSLPFWKRSVIILAGIFVNLLFAVVAFVLIYAVIGIDITNTQTGEVTHFNATIPQALQAGLNVIVMTFQAIIGLFNPQTAAETVSNSTSIVGIAVMSKEYFAAGLVDALFFMALISVSLGLMNLLPIPPLDGGRFLIEIIQKVPRRDLPMKVVSVVSMAGVALFVCFFVFMLNQDIQRFIFGSM